MHFKVFGTWKYRKSQKCLLKHSAFAIPDSKISKMSLKSILLIKKSIKDSEYEKSTSDPAELRNERDLFYSLFDTEDSIEGINAFKEKRDPNFLDK